MNIKLYINVNILKIYTVCVCIYIYMINIYRTHIYYANKNFYFGCNSSFDLTSFNNSIVYDE